MAARTEQGIAAAIAGFVNREIMAPGHRVSPGDAFDVVGIDSMAVLKILLFVEREFGFWVPDEDLVASNLTSATTLARYIAARLGGR